MHCKLAAARHGQVSVGVKLTVPMFQLVGLSSVENHVKIRSLIGLILLHVWRHLWLGVFHEGDESSGRNHHRTGDA